jgi:cytochrome b6-f complex iron-sulfur subunit
MSEGEDAQEVSVLDLLVFLVTQSGTYVAQRRHMNEPIAGHARESMGDGQTRRRFCSQAATLTIIGGALGAILDGCSPTAPSNAPPLPTVSGIRVNGGITLAIDASSPLATVGNAALVQTTVGDFLVARTAQNSFVALAAICTHQTCTITGFGNQSYVCPCHGSTFDVNGRVLGGPAPAALHQYPTQFTSGILTISA